MKKSNTKAERARAAIRFKEFMNGWVGSIRDAEYSDPDSIDGMRYRIPTKAGDLRLTLYMEKDYGPWMAGRFDDVDRAREFFGVNASQGFHGRLNIYSGKWNFQSTYTPDELIDEATSELERLRP